MKKITKHDAADKAVLLDKTAPELTWIPIEQVQIPEEDVNAKAWRETIDPFSQAGYEFFERFNLYDAPVVFKAGKFYKPLSHVDVIIMAQNAGHAGFFGHITEIHPNQRLRYEIFSARHLPRTALNKWKLLEAMHKHFMGIGKNDHWGWDEGAKMGVLDKVCWVLETMWPDIEVSPTALKELRKIGEQADGEKLLKEIDAGIRQHKATYQTLVELGRKQKNTPKTDDDRKEERKGNNHSSPVVISNTGNPITDTLPNMPGGAATNGDAGHKGADQLIEKAHHSENHPEHEDGPEQTYTHNSVRPDHHTDKTLLYGLLLKFTDGNKIECAVDYDNGDENKLRCHFTSLEQFESQMSDDGKRRIWDLHGVLPNGKHYQVFISVEQ